MAFFNPGVVYSSVSVRNEDVCGSHNLFQIHPIDVVERVVVILDHVKNVDDAEAQSPSQATHVTASTKTSEVYLLINFPNARLHLLCFHQLRVLYLLRLGHNLLVIGLAQIYAFLLQGFYYVDGFVDFVDFIENFLIVDTRTDV